MTIKIILEDMETGKAIHFHKYEEFFEFLKPFLSKNKLKLRTEVK
jgi:hypothetical protein